MIRQLGRLSRPVAAAGPGGFALAVYAEADDGALELRAAADQGFEGVACVDDAARAAGLYCLAWQKQRLPWARQAAAGFLRFVSYMQEPDGRFANFILDWSGRKNQTGPSSFVGGWPWTARAMHALARAASLDGEWAERFQLGLRWLDQPCPYLDVRAVCVLAALDCWAATGSRGLADRAQAWAEQIAASRLPAEENDPAESERFFLPDVPGKRRVHLWGHLQEAALARAGQAFERADLVEIARQSAEVVLVPPVERAFDRPTTLPFDVSCAVAGLAAVAEATGEPRYALLAERARGWFRGRNPAGRPVYDPRRGLVHDGVDNGRLNANSGAESNVEGALALFDSLPWRTYRAKERKSERARDLPTLVRL